jgi:flagellar protein FlaG
MQFILLFITWPGPSLPQPMNRTCDFKVISTVASVDTAQIWMKNIGTEPIALTGGIRKSDVFCGAVGEFDRLTYQEVEPTELDDGEWTEDLYDLDSNGIWDPGETVKITAKTTLIPSAGKKVYFQFTLPNGVWRSQEFTVSTGS